MKKFTLTILAVTLAAFVWTSCIDNAVSPEVQALRAAQVDLLKAKTAYQAAQNAYQDALNARQLILNDEESENLRRQKAANDYQVAQYAAWVKQQELALQQATNDLAEYIASHKLTLAGQYLSYYLTETSNLSQLYIDKADAQSTLAYDQQLIDAGTNEAYDQLKVEYQRALATAQATLTAETATLTAMQAVAADPSTAQTALSNAKASLLDLKNKRDQLDIDLANATKAETEANKKVTDAQTTITTYDGKVTALATNANNIIAKQKEITDQQKVVSDLAISLSTQTAQLAPYDAELSTRKAAYDAILATATALYNTWQIEESKLAAAQINNPAASTTARDNAKNAFQATTVAGAGAPNPSNPTGGSDLEKAKTAYNNINNKYSGPGQPAYDLKAAIATLNDPNPATNGSIAKAQADLVTLQTALSGLNVTKADLTAEKAALETAHTDAVTNLEAYKTAAALATNAKTPINNAISDNTAAKNALSTLVTTLTNSLDDLNAAIETQKTTVETATHDVADAQRVLDDNQISKDEAVAKLEADKEDVASYTAQIAAKIALIAKWKALLDAALS